MLIQTCVNLISRGSEILRRDLHDEAIDPRLMGYAMAGVVPEVGGEAMVAYDLHYDRPQEALGVLLLSE